MTAVCPEGHQSSTDDFCDVCGAPIPPAVLAPPAAVLTPPAAVLTPPSGRPAGTARPDSTPPPATKPCPNCATPNAADALFCEDCGYDFATGQLPPPLGAGAPAAAPAAPAALVGVDWVAEIWVDPDWFAHEGAEGGCPTSGAPAVVALRGATALIGRRSRSRNLAPEIDCSSDGAISHSHAELARTGDQWSVRDLGSTNGTYVGRAGGELPASALAPRTPHELADDERIYLGAWTRIVVRRATAAERAA